MFEKFQKYEEYNSNIYTGFFVRDFLKLADSVERKENNQS